MKRSSVPVRGRSRYWAEQWDPLRTKFTHTLRLDGAHYHKYNQSLAVFPDAPLIIEGRWRDDVRHSPGKEWAYANRILPAYTRLNIYQGRKQGSVIFDSDVALPTLFWAPALYDTMMSCTPSEMFTMRQGIRLSTGTVMVGGLGLGWFLRLAAAKKSVKRVIVVEKSQDLLDWFGSELCAKIADDTKTPVEVICDDVWNHVGEHGADVRHMLDIWIGYQTYTCDLDEEHQAKAASVKYFWGWGMLAEPASTSF